MSEEDAIDVLKNSIADYVISEYCEKCSDYTVCENRNEDCYFTQAIDTVLNLISKLQKENEKQGKVIDEMINHIEHTCYYQDDYSNSCDIIQDTCVKSDKNCKDCIKQYFYRKEEEQ